MTTTELALVTRFTNRVADNVERVILGKRGQIEYLLIETQSKQVTQILVS